MLGALPHQRFSLGATADFLREIPGPLLQLRGAFPQLLFQGRLRLRGQFLFPGLGASPAVHFTSGQNQGQNQQRDEQAAPDAEQEHETIVIAEKRIHIRSIHQKE